MPPLLLARVHAQISCEVSHVDFCCMESAEESDIKYLFVLKDDRSASTRLLPFSDPDSKMATNVISKWYLYRECAVGCN